MTDSTNLTDATIAELSGNTLYTDELIRTFFGWMPDKIGWTLQDELTFHTLASIVEVCFCMVVIRVIWRVIAGLLPNGNHTDSTPLGARLLVWVISTMVGFLLVFDYTDVERGQAPGVVQYYDMVFERIANEGNETAAIYPRDR